MSRNNPSSRTQESTRENQIHSKPSTKRTRLTRIQNPGGHKEDWASFPTQSQYKDLKNPYLKSLERRGRKNKREEKGRQAQGEERLFLLVARREGERRGVRGI